jgi:hypothetical protein
MHDGWTAGEVSKVGSRPPTRVALRDSGLQFLLRVSFVSYAGLVDWK